MACKVQRRITERPVRGLAKGNFHPAVISHPLSGLRNPHLNKFIKRRLLLANRVASPWDM